MVIQKTLRSQTTLEDFCSKYRYNFEERLCYIEYPKASKFLLFVGLNPSHADKPDECNKPKTDKTIEKINDLVISKFKDYGFIVLNLSHQRSPDPKRLQKIHLDRNYEQIEKILTTYNVSIKKVVLFWGNGISKHLFLIESALKIKSFLDAKLSEVEWCCVERNKSGIRHPKHFGRMSKRKISEISLMGFSKNDLKEYFTNLELRCNSQSGEK